MALVAGLLTLVLAVSAFVGQVPDLSGFDVRWLFACAAVGVGVLLLARSRRGRSG